MIKQVLFNYLDEFIKQKLIDYRLHRYDLLDFNKCIYNIILGDIGYIGIQYIYQYRSDISNLYSFNLKGLINIFRKLFKN